MAQNYYDNYMQTLTEAFNPGTLENVMCRTTVSVAWNGTLYDCDFNQMLGLPIGPQYSGHIENFDMQRG
jgi:hypothetical protein